MEIKWILYVVALTTSRTRWPMVGYEREGGKKSFNSIVLSYSNAEQLISPTTHLFFDKFSLIFNQFSNFFNWLKSGCYHTYNRKDGRK